VRAAREVASGRMREAGGALRALARMAGHAARSAGDAPGGLLALGEGLDAILRPAPSTALDDASGPQRTVAYADVGLEAVKEAGRRHGATVNDVLLAASSVALGAALRRRGEALDELKALVPVDVRGQGEGAGTGLGNRISFLFAGLPVAETDPVVVLGRVRAQTREAKRGGHAAPLSALVGAAELLPRRGRALAARTAVKLASFNVIVSNVPGPPIPLFLMGRRVTALLPAIPVVAGHALTIGALSYVGRLGIGLYADARTIPDLVTIARDLESALDALRVAPPPGARTDPRGATAG
jgi:diacylglycerol O-acyltransferase